MIDQDKIVDTVAELMSRISQLEQQVLKGTEPWVIELEQRVLALDCAYKQFESAVAQLEEQVKIGVKIQTTYYDNISQQRLLNLENEVTKLHTERIARHIFPSISIPTVFTQYPTTDSGHWEMTWVSDKVVEAPEAVFGKPSG